MKRMIEDKLEETSSEPRYYEREVLGGNVTVRTRIEDTEEPTAAELRKGTPVYSGVLKYFPKAIKYVSQVSKAGNDQHHPDKPLHWDRSKSQDETDALARHLIDHSIDPVDTDGMLHLGKVAWRALAALEKHLEE